MENLHLEKSQIYILSASAMRKLLRLCYGVGAGEYSIGIGLILIIQVGVWILLPETEKSELLPR